MKIGHVKITNFRSILQAEFKISGGKVAFVGGNESGKSNILLAIQRFLNQDNFGPDDKYQLVNTDPEIEIEFESLTQEEETLMQGILKVNPVNKLKISRLGNSYKILAPSPRIIQESENQEQKDAEREDEGETNLDLPQVTTEVLKHLPKAVVVKTVQGLIKGRNIPLIELYPENPDDPPKSTFTRDEINTIQNFLNLGGITKEDIFEEDTALCFQIINRKASEIARMLSSAWKQERIEIRMSVDSENLVIQFKDCGNILEGEAGLDPSKWIWTFPEDRSDGFRWFVTFFSSHLYGQSQSSNLIYLIDEAGGFLNKKAQIDLLKEFDKIANNGKNNQIIYASHSKYMVSWDFRDEIYAVIKNPGAGSTVNDKWWSKYTQDLLPSPLDELGVTWSHDLLASQNLIIEGPVDFEVITGLRKIFQPESSDHDVISNFKLIPAMGRFNSMTELGEACKFHRKKALLLFDSDIDGISGRGECRNKSLIADDISSLCAEPAAKIITIEDFLPRKVYLRFFNEAGIESFGERWQNIDRLQQVDNLGLIEASKKRLKDVVGLTDREISQFLRDKKYQIAVNVLRNSSVEDFSPAQKLAIPKFYTNLNQKLATL